MMSCMTTVQMLYRQELPEGNRLNTGENTHFLIFEARQEKGMRYQNDGACPQADIGPGQKPNDGRPDQESMDSDFPD